MRLSRHRSSPHGEPRLVLARRLGAALLATVIAAAPTALRAQASPPQDSTSQPPATDSTQVQELAPVTVTGRYDDLIGTAASASEGRVGAADLRQRPITREGELLETVPGVIVTQHSGDGKANQYFTRGFNLDHGTDFQTRLEGMPLNMPSHAHGQGYTDLNFLIPELVDYLDYRLGVYHTELGDFGSAGGVEFHLLRRLDRPFAAVSAGEDGLARFAGGGSGQVGGEAKAYNGPWEVAEELRKFSGLARYTWDRGASQFSVLGMAYHNQWNASDQIPLRAVEAGLINRFGEIDGSDGGNTQRYSLSGSWCHAGTSSVQDVQLFGIYSDLSLFSNFEYFLGDPARGDQFNQREQRVVIGGNAKHIQEMGAWGVPHLIKVGVQTRADVLRPVGLYRTEARSRLSTVWQDDVTEWGSGARGSAASWAYAVTSTRST